MNDDKALINSHIEFLQEQTGNYLFMIKGGQDSLKRFIYCCVEKIAKCSETIKMLYPLIYENEDTEFSLGIVLRSLLMDSLLTQYLRYLSLTANEQNHEQIKAEIKKYSLMFIAGGTSQIIGDFTDFAPVSDAKKKEIALNISAIFPNVFYLNDSGLPQLRKQYRVNIKELFRKSSHELMYTRRTVYELYAYYSKYDHVSHWTSVLGNIPIEERIKKASSSIVMILYNFRDLLVVSQFHDELAPFAPTIISNIDQHVRSAYPDLK